MQVQRWLGYHSASFTLDTYVHLLDNEAIITGDLDLLAIDSSQLAVDVVTPRQFVERLG